MEAMGCQTVFGDAAPPITSNKSMVGHTLTAAGRRRGRVLAAVDRARPRAAHDQLPSADPAIPLDIVGNVARDMRVTSVMSNSFGFGGQNTSLVMTAERCCEREPPMDARRRCQT